MLFLRKRIFSQGRFCKSLLQKVRDALQSFAFSRNLPRISRPLSSLGAFLLL